MPIFRQVGFLIFQERAIIAAIKPNVAIFSNEVRCFEELSTEWETRGLETHIAPAVISRPKAFDLLTEVAAVKP
jgi:hypothetical protein